MKVRLHKLCKGVVCVAFFYVITSGKDLAERKQGTLVANSAMR